MDDKDNDSIRYCGSHVACVPFGSTRVLAHAAELDLRCVIDVETARVLQMCTAFCSLDEHAARCAASTRDPATVRSRLAQLVKAGLLVSEADSLALCDRSAPAADDAARIESIGIATRDRPALLRRCLDAIGDTLTRTRRDVRIVVADDSIAPGSQRQNSDTVADFARRHGVKVQYIGASERAALLGSLVERSGVPLEIVELGVRGPSDTGITTGANRNTLLLATAGELTMQVDDDVVWNVAPVPGQLGGVRSWPQGRDPTSFSFHADLQSAVATVVPGDVDPIKLHEHVLGRTLGQCVHAAAGPGPLVEGPVDHGFLRHLLSGAGRVMATSFGVAGDAGMWSSNGFLMLRDESLRNLLASYETAIRTRALTRGVHRMTLTRHSFFMAFTVGLDNRAPLPPFLPGGRNQDGVYSVLAPGCIPDGYFAHLPWLVQHLPEEVRSWRAEAVWADIGVSRLSTLAIAAIVSWRPTHAPATPAQRMAAIGRHLQELAALAPEDFRSVARDHLWRLLDWQLRGVEQNARELGGAAPRFQQDAARQLAQAAARAVSEESLAPADLLAEQPAGERLARTQTLLGGYGQLVTAWPALREAARDLRSER